MMQRVFAFGDIGRTPVRVPFETRRQNGVRAAAAPVAENGPAVARGARQFGHSPQAREHYVSLQRIIGNSGVKRLLESSGRGAATTSKAFRAPVINDELHLRASLFTQSDEFERLDAAFHNRPTLTANDNGPAVALFQQALVAAGYRMPRSTTPDGDMDGKWGEETSAVVRRFQADNGIDPGGFEAGRKTLLALDAHLLGAQPPQPVPPQPKPVPPQPQPPAQNQELETVMNQISIAYQLVLTRERDGVEALCRDLTNLDKPQPSALLQLVATMLQGLIPPLYGFLEGALRQAIKKVYKDALDPSDAVLTDMDNANDKVFDALIGSVNDTISGLKQSSPSGSRANLLADFCDAQLDQVTKGGFASLSSFESDGKKALRNSTATSSTKHDSRNQSGDHRVDAAFAMLDAVNKIALTAFNKRYDEALHVWDSKLAQSQLGLSPGDLRDTNLAPLTGDKDIPAGVLRIAIFPELDEKSEELISANIDGLSARARDKLAGNTGASIALPMIVEGPTGGRRLRIGITEHHEILDLTTSNSGGQWLTARGDGDRRQGVLRVADTILKSKVPDIQSR